MKADPGFYDYWPYENRPKIEWPNGARIAFWVAPNIEFYELDPAVNPHRKAWPRPVPDIQGYGTRDYGNRVGHMRMMEVLDRRRLCRIIIVNQIDQEANLEVLTQEIQKTFGAECLPINLPADGGLASPGGYVMDSRPGLYDNVLVLDFKSLYPSIIRTFKIDPMGLVTLPTFGEQTHRRDGGSWLKEQAASLATVQSAFAEKQVSKKAGKGYEEV